MQSGDMQVSYLAKGPQRIFARLADEAFASP